MLVAECRLERMALFTHLPVWQRQGPSSPSFSREKQGESIVGVKPREGKEKAGREEEGKERGKEREGGEASTTW